MVVYLFPRMYPASAESRVFFPPLCSRIACSSLFSVYRSSASMNSFDVRLPWDFTNFLMADGLMYDGMVVCVSY